MRYVWVELLYVRLDVLFVIIGGIVLQCMPSSSIWFDRPCWKITWFLQSFHNFIRRVTKSVKKHLLTHRCFLCRKRWCWQEEYSWDFSAATASIFPGIWSFRSCKFYVRMKPQFSLVRWHFPICFMNGIPCCFINKILTLLFFAHACWQHWIFSGLFAMHWWSRNQWMFYRRYMFTWWYWSTYRKINLK